MKFKNSAILITLCFCYNQLSAQVKINYGIILGISQNEKNTQHQHTTPEIRNAHVVQLTEGFISPVLGINTRICYGNLYSSVGLEYNKTGTYNYNFESREYYKGDDNGNLHLKTYNDNSTSYSRISKLNLPLEFGFQVMKNYDLSPFVFSGVNLTYILKGKFHFIENKQDVYSEVTTTTVKEVSIYDRHDDYYSAGRRFNAQLIIGGGLKIKKHFSVRASIRSRNYIGVYENLYSRNFNSDRFSAFDITYKEYNLTCAYHF
ncbi:MAG: outer membrane beta-barrel protein [Chitinophagaceae bacterium]|nr:outer membrane beta-barrel protein [Chitinophagaceae bacterium]